MTSVSSYNRNTKRLRLFCIVLVMPVIFLSAYSATASQYSKLEYEVKSAYIFNYLYFTEWLAKPYFHHKDPLIIGIVGDRFVYRSLESIESKKINDRSIELKPIEASVENIKNCNCQIIFFSHHIEVLSPSILDALHQDSILTIGESQDFSRKGGIINFIVRKNKVKFNINLNSASKAKIKFRSKMLRAAHHVVRE